MRAGHHPINLTGKLFRFASNTSQLKDAWDFLERRGGTAPGPDDIRYGDFTAANGDRWTACRVLREAIRDHTYTPGRERIVHIPKSSGHGTRPICLQSVLDRVVQRSIASILHPLLDPDFDPRSFGFRPGLGGRPGPDRRHALAAAQSLAFAEGRFVWVLADIRDAFGSVPLGRLRDVLRSRIPDSELLTLIDTTLVRTAPGCRRNAGFDKVDRFRRCC